MISILPLCNNNFLIKMHLPRKNQVDVRVSYIHGGLVCSCSRQGYNKQNVYDMICYDNEPNSIEKAYHNV